MNRLGAILLAACVIVFGPGRAAGASPASRPRAADAGKISVYVFTRAPASRITTIDELARGEALQQLTHYLRKKHRLLLVNDAHKADVVIELLSSVQLFRPGQQARFDEHQLTAEVTAGKQKTRITASRHGTEATTQKLAGRIDKWIRENVKPQAH